MDIPFVRPSKTGQGTAAAAGGQHEAGHRQQHQPVSSLDIAWSYSRSTARIGSVLPSEPSFVEHYRPQLSTQPHFNSDSHQQQQQHEADLLSATSSSATGHHQPLLEEDSDHVMEHHHYGSASSSSSASSSTSDSLPWPQEEHLPPNALRKHYGTLTTTSQQQTPRPLSPPRPPPFYQRTSETDSEHAPYTSSVQHVEHYQPAPAETETETDAEAALSTSPPHDIPFARRARSFSYEHTHRDDDDLEAAAAAHASSVAAAQGDLPVSLGGHGSSDLATLFNLVNVLLGISIFALPRAFAHCGWCGALAIMLACSTLTAYTAKVMADVVKRFPHLVSYTDIIALGLGGRSRAWINGFFVAELGTVCISLLILSADNFFTLFPSFSPAFFKFCSLAFTVPCVFLPLRLLSYTSFMGLMSIVLLLSVILFDGFYKQEAPGSLLHPAPTSFTPHWSQVPLSFGVMFAGFAGHAIVPSLYKDMKRPEHFNRVVNAAWAIASAVNVIVAAAGYLMFGPHVSAEVSQDVLQSGFYPEAVNKVLVWCMAISPLLKFTLVFTPLHVTFESALGLRPCQVMPTMEDETKRPSPRGSTSGGSSSQEDETSPISSKTATLHSPQMAKARMLFHQPAYASVSPAPAPVPPQPTKTTFRWLFKAALVALLAVVAVTWPSFEQVMSLLGALGATTVCVMLPLAASLSIRWSELSALYKTRDVVLIFVAFLMAASGTVASLRPSH